MTAGLVSLVSFAVVMGAAFPYIETLLNTRLPENTLTRYLPEILGLSAALAGLTLGWLIPSRRLLGPLLAWSQRGFAIAGGFDKLLVKPAFAIADRCEKLERVLYEAVLAMGRLGLVIGRATRRNDEQGIDEMIFSFVRGTINLGSKTRRLQSGLIHREMALSTVASVAIFAIMLIAILVY